MLRKTPSYLFATAGKICLLLLLWLPARLPAQTVSTLIDEADQLLGQAAYEEAVEHYLRAVVLQEESGDSERIMECYYGIGYAYLQMGRMSEFAAFEPQILPYMGLQDEYLPDVLVALGSSHRHLDHLQKALHYYQRAIELSPEDDPDYQETLAGAYNNSGIIYRWLGDTERALLHYQKTLQFYQDSPLNYARTLANVGQLYRSKGQAALARQHYEQALDTLNAHPALDRTTRAIIEDDMAMLLDEAGEHREAIRYLNSVNDLLDEDHSFRSNLLRHYGQVYLHQEDFVRAERYFRQSLALREAQYPQPHIRKAVLHEDLGERYLQAGEAEKALREFQQSIYHLSGGFQADDLHHLPDLQRISYPRDMLRFLDRKAAAWQAWFRQSGDQQALQDAQQTYQLATRLADTLRLSYWGEEAKLLLSESVVPLYEAAIQNALLLYENTHDNRWLSEAYYFAAKNKAAILREQIRAEQALSGAGLPDSLILAERELRYLLAQSEQQMLTFPDSLALQTQRFELYRAHQGVVEQMEKGYPAFLQLKNEAVFADPQAVLERLPAGAMLLEFFWGTKAVQVFCLQKGTIRHHQIAVRERLQQELLAFLQILRDPEGAELSGPQQLQDYQQQSFGLYRQLLAPALEGQEFAQLLIVPDGPLGYMPFASLCTDTLPQRHFSELAYLLHRAPIRYLYAVHTLWDEELPLAAENFGGFAPLFDGPASGQRFGKPGRLDNQSVVKAMAQKWSGHAYLNGEASRTRFLAEAGRYQVLHLATHGFTDAEEAGRSGLWFNGDSSETAIVYAYEIYHLPLQARLAVLSACETGTGQLQQGEGIYSLARAFRAAGCGTTVMSLWQVNDKSTRELMEAFYDQLDQQNVPGRALQKARQIYLQNHDLAHPYYWSAFVVIGQDGKLEIQSPYGWLWWVLGGLLLLGLGIFAVKKVPLQS